MMKIQQILCLLFTVLKNDNAAFINRDICVATSFISFVNICHFFFACWSTFYAWFNCISINTIECRVSLAWIMTHVFSNYCYYWFLWDQFCDVLIIYMFVRDQIWSFGHVLPLPVAYRWPVQPLLRKTIRSIVLKEIARGCVLLLLLHAAVHYFRSTAREGIERGRMENVGYSVYFFSLFLLVARGVRCVGWDGISPLWDCTWNDGDGYMSSLCAMELKWTVYVQVNMYVCVVVEQHISPTSTFCRNENILLTFSIYFHIVPHKRRQYPETWSTFANEITSRRKQDNF